VQAASQIPPAEPFFGRDWIIFRHGRLILPHGGTILWGQRMTIWAWSARSPVWWNRFTSPVEAFYRVAGRFYRAVEGKSRAVECPDGAAE
jgi:hypothetical protein